VPAPPPRMTLNTFCDRKDAEKIGFDAMACLWLCSTRTEGV
jgi:hypothetical protein